MLHFRILDRQSKGEGDDDEVFVSLEIGTNEPLSNLPPPRPPPPSRPPRTSVLLVPPPRPPPPILPSRSRSPLPLAIPPPPPLPPPGFTCKHICRRAKSLKSFDETEFGSLAWALQRAVQHRLDRQREKSMEQFDEGNTLLDEFARLTSSSSSSNESGDSIIERVLKRTHSDTGNDFVTVFNLNS